MDIEKFNKIGAITTIVMAVADILLCFAAMLFGVAHSETLFDKVMMCIGILTTAVAVFAIILFVIEIIRD